MCAQRGPFLLCAVDRAQHNEEAKDATHYGSDVACEVGLVLLQLGCEDEVDSEEELVDDEHIDVLKCDGQVGRPLNSAPRLLACLALAL